MDARAAMLLRSIIWAPSNGVAVLEAHEGDVGVVLRQALVETGVVRTVQFVHRDEVNHVQHLKEVIGRSVQNHGDVVVPAEGMLRGNAHIPCCETDLGGCSAGRRSTGDSCGARRHGKTERWRVERL